MRASEISQAHQTPPAQGLPHPQTTVRAGLSGFPSPAVEYVECTLNPNQRLMKRPSATFFMILTGDSMEGFNIQDSDTLVALVDGRMIVKRYEILGQRPYLYTGNDHYASPPVLDLDCQMWGVARSVIHEYPA